MLYLSGFVAMARVSLRNLIYYQTLDSTMTAQYESDDAHGGLFCIGFLVPITEFT